MSAVLSAVKNVWDFIPGYVWTIFALAIAYIYNLYSNQNSLLYHPVLPNLPFKKTSENPPPYNSPSALGLDYENIYFRAADGVNLHAWFVKGKGETDHRTLPTIVFFHANAGNMGLRMPNILALASLPANVFIFDYRGYGNSDDVPIHEEGLRLDGEAALEYIRSRSDIDKSKVVLFGRSLGGAVALHTASKYPRDIAGIILENTFTSISDMVDHVFPFLSKLKWLILKIRWESIKVIPEIDHPLLFISGGKDQLVPPYMLANLYAAATRSRNKMIHVVPDGDHNDTFQKGGAEYLLKIHAFLRSIKVETTTRPHDAKTE